MVEWTGQQQLLFLLQSGGMGFLLGGLFEVFTAVGRLCRRRWHRFLLDAFFGIPAALITFFCALAIMDGALHPLLFFGGFVGFLAEHISVGRLLGAGLYAALRCSSRLWRRSVAVVDGVLVKIGGKIAAFFRKFPHFLKIEKKSSKKRHFFEKNS